MVVACDGVNSFLAKEAGLLAQAEASAPHPGCEGGAGAAAEETINERFGVQGNEGVDIEMLGCTRSVPGGGFLYTNADTVSVGVVLSLPELASSGIRPEELIADLKDHPSIAPYLRGSTLREYAAHLIPEGGYDTMPPLAADGMVVAGDAAAMTLAAGLWLEGVNFAIGSGDAAGRAVDRAIAAGDWSAGGLASYREELERQFVLADHKRAAQGSGPGPVRTGPAPLSGAPLRPRRRDVHRDQSHPQARGPAGHPCRGGPARRQAAGAGRRHPPGIEDLRMRWPGPKRTEPDATPAPAPAPEAAGDAGSVRWRGVSFEDRMATVDFRVGERAHITVDSDVCRSCTTRTCVTACPADLFAPTSDGGILFNYEECFECGTCYMVCNQEGAITWTYPDGGHGVVFHHG